MKRSDQYFLATWVPFIGFIVYSLVAALLKTDILVMIIIQDVILGISFLNLIRMHFHDRRRKAEY